MHWHLMSDLRFILLYLIYSDMGQLQRVLNSIRYEGTDGPRKETRARCPENEMMIDKGIWLAGLRNGSTWVALEMGPRARGCMAK